MIMDTPDGGSSVFPTLMLEVPIGQKDSQSEEKPLENCLINEDHFIIIKQARSKVSSGTIK